MIAALPFLEGWWVAATGAPGGPAARAARALAELGARAAWSRGSAETLRRIGGAAIGTAIPAARSPIEAEYLGLLAASAHLTAQARVPAAARGGLREGVLGDRGAVLVRCADGWVAARWREESEPRLLTAMVGEPRRARVAEVWRAARTARLLIAPVRERPRRVAALRVLEPVRASGTRAAVGRIVDWTNLWAGPWATGALAADGVPVTRIEVAARRDGYVATPAGRLRWNRWNGRKTLRLLDARRAPDRRTLGAAIAGADTLVSGQTARVLPQLGFDETWFARRAPALFRLTLCAYDEPGADLPGLGEQAGALAGLLWRGDGRPAAPHPWADPLLGAWALLVLRARRASGVAFAGHVRLSLEAAAGRVHRGGGRMVG